ncbi:MAG: TraX family protein [Alphaproteobacteria bacterium]
MNSLLALKKNIPAQITSYDFLKFFAVATMIVDHLGAYFYPDDMWWRAVGRLSAPVWLFLIGFAKSRDLSPPLWVGASLLVVASFLFGGNIFPANILILFVFIRPLIDKVAVYMLSDYGRMIAVSAILFTGSLVTAFFMDYGSIGFLVALYGYMARRRVDGNPVSAEVYFASFVFLSYFLFAYATFDFSSSQAHFTLLAIGVVFFALYYFKPVVFSGQFERTCPGWIKAVLRVTGRRSLEIYVGHLLLFKCLAAFYETSDHSFFGWHWY